MFASGLIRQKATSDSASRTVAGFCSGRGDAERFLAGDCTDDRRRIIGFEPSTYGLSWLDTYEKAPRILASASV
jgi:hypothetical protein